MNVHGHLDSGARRVDGPRCRELSTALRRYPFAFTLLLGCFFPGGAQCEELDLRLPLSTLVAGNSVVVEVGLPDEAECGLRLASLEIDPPLSIPPAEVLDFYLSAVLVEDRYSYGGCARARRDSFALHLPPLPVGAHELSVRVSLPAGEHTATATLEIAGTGSRHAFAGGRFLAEVRWLDGAEARPAYVVPLPESSGDTAVFWFFSRDNWELVLKVLRGCAWNGHYWIFGTASTDLPYRVEVIDTSSASGGRWFLERPPGLGDAFADVRAFPCDAES